MLVNTVLTFPSVEDQVTNPNSPSHGSERTEPVRPTGRGGPLSRSRVSILDMTLSSLTVDWSNPPKDETVRIRKLLLENSALLGECKVCYMVPKQRHGHGAGSGRFKLALSRSSNPVRAAGAINMKQYFFWCLFCFFSVFGSFSYLLAFDLVLLLLLHVELYLYDNGVDPPDLFSISGQMGLKEFEHSPKRV
ncbi:hypothetical protein HHK36_032956 [Tetracentron sinense]|uniref:Uncharacterized protein n=1 Tax=Tetracentron sinense TaxID=13715 RepID=A0A834YA48_TETSI|nr:hypothetical protein HHK36_032956 [Tetracentron sinense]